MSIPKHPMQPVQFDDNIIRFKHNAIVRYLLDAGPFDMNTLSAGRFTVEDREQFAQLIGYSVSGFGDLSYVRDQTCATAEALADQLRKEKP